jgi:hypothetical protein
MKKFIIMTTAIIRPELHNTSIKKFYDVYYLKNKEFIDKNFEIYHIINLDSPEKLKDHSNSKDTINNFNDIIPEKINKIFIETDVPSFSRAYINIMNKIKELDLLSENNYYWWFEDDWELQIENFKFFNIVDDILNFTNCAMTLVRNTPLGSFRGGPIMNGKYFMNHFNLINLNIINYRRDPERQVSHYMTASNCAFTEKEEPMIRQLNCDYDKKINIVLIYLDTAFGKVNGDFFKGYYDDNFNKEIEFTYHIILINKYNLHEVLYVKSENSNFTNLNNYKKVSFIDVKNIIDSKSITYFIIKPFTFEDCGRDFAKNHNLIKWVNTRKSNLTYL